jgi:membrane-associated protease RseP (regulator of RpoE activity)
MKSKYLLPILTLLSPALFAAGAAAASGAAVANGSSVVVNSAGGTGKATITIDVNGKKETREIELGNGTEIKVGSGHGITIKTEATSGGEPAPMKTWLGVASEEIPDAVRAQLPLAEGTGLLVQSVAADSPAAKAGLTKNDVLVKFDDQLLTNAEQLRTLVRTRKDGEHARLTYLRRGQEAVADVTLGTRAGGDETGEGGLLGLFGRNWNFDVKKLLPSLNVQSRAVVIDKDGNVVGGQGGGEIGNAVKQLEQTLRNAGVDPAVIEQLERALGQAGNEIQKAAGDLSKKKEDVSRDVEKAVRDATKAVEEAREAAELVEKRAQEAAEEFRRGKPAAPTTPLEKQP